MLYITTRYGLFRYSEEEKEIKHLLTNWDTAKGLTLPSNGIFGIDLHTNSGNLILASRENRTFPWFGRVSRSKKLHSLDPETLEREEIKTLYGLYDVHQIEVYKSWVFITDAVENRVPVFDLKKGTITKILNIGQTRKDFHHVNTALVRDGLLYLGLNCSPDGPGKILKYPIDKFKSSQHTNIDILSEGELEENGGVKHTHDLVPFDGTFLINASHQGYIYRADTGKKIADVSDWSRGICITNKGIWVGSSEKQKNREKRARKSDGKIYLYDKNTGEKLDEVVLPQSGQIYDLISHEATDQ